MRVPLPQLPLLGRPWHAEAPCIPDEQGDLWAVGFAFGGRWDQKWFADHVCSACPVADECLDDAMRFWDALGQNPDGVWGGLTKPERERLRAVWLAEEAEPGHPGEAA